MPYEYMTPYPYCIIWIFLIMFFYKIHNFICLAEIKC